MRKNFCVGAYSELGQRLACYNSNLTLEAGPLYRNALVFTMKNLKDENRRDAIVGRMVAIVTFISSFAFVGNWTTSKIFSAQSELPGWFGILSAFVGLFAAVRFPWPLELGKVTAAIAGLFIVPILLVMLLPSARWLLPSNDFDPVATQNDPMLAIAALSCFVGSVGWFIYRYRTGQVTQGEQSWTSFVWLCYLALTIGPMIASMACALGGLLVLLLLLINEFWDIGFNGW